MTLLNDCEHFVREFFVVLSTSSQQVYHSALMFTPSETLFGERYGNKLPRIRVQNGCQKKWNLFLWTMDGHSSCISSVAFSPDGTHIVSGSYDHTLRLWDAVSGAHLNTLNGHSNGITSIAFSPDGTLIVSGSADRTLRLWDAASSAHLNTFEGHSSRITSVAFSPDGTHIVSGSHDKTLRLWDAVSGAYLGGYSGITTFSTFSLNSTSMISSKLPLFHCLSI
jgi:WD40 repeat protein